MENRRSSNDFLPGAVAQWRVRWTIVGEQVVCKSRGATQARHHCQQLFAHHKGCACDTKHVSCQVLRCSLMACWRVTTEGFELVVRDGLKRVLSLEAEPIYHSFWLSIHFGLIVFLLSVDSLLVH